MKKILLVLMLSMLLVGCGNEQNVPRETHTVSGIITNRNCMYYTTYLTIETEDGIKIPVYESHSSFSDGVEIGDKVKFEVEKIECSGYKIVGISLE